MDAPTEQIGEPHVATDGISGKLNDAVVDHHASPTTSDPKSSTAMEMTTEDIDRHEANGSVDPSTTLTSTAAPETPPSMTKPSLPSDPANLKKQSKRKSIAVPEHRVKRTPKKPGLEPQLNVEPGQYWLCKMSGYPDWPCIICDESILSKEMRNQRPVTARQPDGEFKPDYADGGRKERERTYPVLFLDSFLSFSWAPNTTLSPINIPDALERVEKTKMRKDLVESFQLASQNHELDYFRTLLEDLAKQRAEYLAQKEAGKAKKGKDPAKKIYLRMGSGRDDDNDTEDAEDDQESTNTANEVDVDADDFADSDGKTKKRKKEVDSDSDTPRSTKRSKVSKSKSSTRLKLPMAKTDPASKAPSAGRSKGGKSSKQSPSNRHGYQLTRPTARSSDDEQVTTPLDPAEEKEKQILFLRHRLQKGFLTKEKIPSSSEMPALADLIMKLEGQEDLEVSIIRKTKIHKVLRGITKLNNIPRDSDFNFRQRALSLLEKWNANMAGEPETPGLLDDGKDEKAETGEAKQKPVNGVHKKSKDAIMDDEEMPTAASVLTSTQNASPNTSHPVKGEEEDA